MKLSCLSSQRYNFLKANHNSGVIVNPIRLVVYQVKDTIFWKQITTSLLQKNYLLRLFIKSKIQFFESKSQHICHCSLLLNRCLSSQRYNFLKANHNQYFVLGVFLRVVYQVKDTIFWKQITTHQHNVFAVTCCLSSQRYNFLKANHNVLLYSQ